MAYARVAQPVIKVLLVQRHAAVDRGVHVDLKQHVDTAPQVEPETHRVHAEAAHPVGQLRRQGHRDVRLTRVLSPQPLAGLLLVLGREEAYDDTTVLHVGRFRRDACGLHDTDEFIQAILVEIAAVIGRDLHGVDTAVDVWQRQQAARQQDDEHEHIEPGGVPVHRSTANQASS